MISPVARWHRGLQPLFYVPVGLQPLRHTATRLPAPCRRKNDPEDGLTKRFKSCTITPLQPHGRALKAGGVEFEFAEYLKGETHYIVVTIKKKSLLAHGVLKENLPQAELLSRANLDEAALLRLGRVVATALELPAHTEYCEHHPCKLFNFSTRARSLAGFRVLGVEGGGANAGQVKSADLEAQELLSLAETAWHVRCSADAHAAVDARTVEIAEAEAAAREVTAVLQAAVAAGEEMEVLEQRTLEVNLVNLQACEPTPVHTLTSYMHAHAHVRVHVHVHVHVHMYM